MKLWPPVPVADPPLAEVPTPSTPIALPRCVALAQILAVCGIPTQLAVFGAVALLTHQTTLKGEQVSLEVFALTSLIDTALIALLVAVFLGASGETPAQVFWSRRPPLRECALGVGLLPPVYVGVAVFALALRTIAPSLHTVPTNPFDAYMHTPVEAGVFAVVVVLAGGVREELQRAFILHRFEQRLGGAWIGLAAFTVFFGALHLNEGADAAIAVGMLGLLWGLAYLRRRSMVLPMVNHAGFDLLQIVQVIATRGLT